MAPGRSSDPSPEIAKTRLDAAETALRYLNVDDLSPVSLFNLAGEVLGLDRTERILTLVRLSPLSRRSHALAEAAALILGTRDLGNHWWTQQHQSLTDDRQWVDGGVQDEVALANRHDDPYWPSSVGALEILCSWVEDDAADAQWGRPVDRVDLNNPMERDRFVLPARAKAGDRLVLSFDPGARVWADVSETDGELHSSMDIASLSHVAEAELEWAVGISTNLDLICLPGEEPGTRADPWTHEVDRAAADRVYQWAARRSDRRTIGDHWRTRADVWHARARLGLPYRLTALSRSMDGLVDGDATKLSRALLDLK